MKKPKLEDFKREVYDGQDYADWYMEYFMSLEKYVDELEQALSKQPSIIKSVCDCNLPEHKRYVKEVFAKCPYCGKPT